MHTIDLIFLVLAMVVAYRLYSILGTGKKDSQSKNFNPEVFQAHPKAKPKTQQKVMKKGEDTSPLVTALKQIQHADPSFTQERFLEGAEKAFEIIISSFIKGNKSSLKPLVNTSLFKQFSEAIEQRIAAKHRTELSFFRVVGLKLTDMTIKNHRARLSVEFQSEQTQLLKDAKGKVLEGDPDHIDQITEVWVFERPLKSKTPNWVLVETSAS